MPAGAKCSELIAQRVDDLLVDHTERIGDRRRADLRHETHQASCSYSKLKPATQMTSPSWAPARASDPRHAETLHLEVDVRQRLRCRDVVERHHTLDLSTDEAELVLAHPLDAPTFGLGTDDDDTWLRRVARYEPRAPVTPAGRRAHGHQRLRPPRSAGRPNRPRRCRPSCPRRREGVPATRAGTAPTPAAGSAPARPATPRRLRRGPA